MTNKTPKIHFPFFGIPPWRVVFLATVGLLLLFAVTPRGYAQELVPAGTSSPPAEISPETPRPPSEQLSQTFPYKKRFTISSYYTPLPDQSRFFRGTYEADVRLNGEGVHAADGTLVYPGMAAASKAYPFGTKMEIPGFGMVAIHDRGGAIKGDRLDIWVGRGEEGLQRALGWGMRTLEVTVYGVDPNIQESVNFEEIPLADLSKFLVQTANFKTDLAEDDTGPEVAELQRFLKKLGFFVDLEVTGFFGSQTHEAVQKFQLEEKIIPNLEDPGAGNFGPRSRVAFEALIAKRRQEAKQSVPTPNVKRGDTGESVKNLQMILKTHGFLSEVNGTFDQKTFEALMKFQMEMGLVAKRTDFGAGFYGPKTQKTFEELVTNFWTPGTPFIASLTERKAFTKELAPNNRGPEVGLIQEELKRMSFLGVPPTGYYGKTTEHAVFKFQQAMGIIEKETDSGAGVVGPKTLEKLNEFAASRTSHKKLIAMTTENKQIVTARLMEERNLLASARPSLSEATSLMRPHGATFTAEAVPIHGFVADLVYGTRGNEVEKLQKTLKRLGFFPGRLTTQYFGDITKQSVSSFQKSHGLLETGVLDPQTRKLLNGIMGTV